MKKRKLKVKFKKLFIFSFFLLLIPFVSKLFSDILANPVNYIYLDLNCSDIVFDSDNYSGCVYKTVDGITSSVEVSGKHSETNYYYIYQSNSTNKSSTGYVNGGSSIIIPVYTSLVDTIESFIDNTDVEGVISTWRTNASKAGRESTENKISISGTSTFDLTIDNLYSSYQISGNARTSGGIAFNPTKNSSLKIRLKGENRFGNIHYTTDKSDNTNTLEITSYNGENETEGSLVVANINSNASTNHYNSGIGASDGTDDANGIKITGGTIYVGTNMADDCTSIGGGGNGKGTVTITGGIITAVSSSTGAAIGGGIGESSYGGDAVITITGGTIYAYNLGYVYSGNGTFIPGVAIGGGSSRLSSGNLNTEINITGGTIYAQSVGGVAIGGGNTATLNGGPAVITIGENANVTADSVAGSYTYNNLVYQVLPGSGIGGGTGGKTGNGGTATVNINGGTIKSGTIGGGETNATDTETYSVGDANVTITGGEVIGRVLMYKGTFEMTGGVLTGGNSENGGCVQMYSGTATITGGEIKKCIAAEQGGAIYLAGGTFYSKGGKIYDNSAKYGAGIYIASGVVEMSAGDIELNNAELNGGGIAIDGSGSFNMTGGALNNNKSLSGSGGGIYLAGGNVNITDGHIENNESSIDGGGIYLDDGFIEMFDGYIKNNKTTLNGGGISIGGTGSFTMSGGNINNNTSLSGNGGGISVASGNITMYDGNIEANEAINGGGFYLTAGTFEIKNGSLITKNKAVNGAGGYVQDGIFNLTGGTTSNNIATLNGGGYYIVDTETATLSNGIISNNEAKNGGGFYQTQTSGRNTSTTLSGTCYVNNNKAYDGNGGGVYVDGGSLFRLINGKVIYNSATGTPSETDLKSYLYNNNTQTNNKIVYAKDSTAGVGGGVYIKNGTFTMKNADGTDGTAAIFGNIADYAADDLFSYGNSLTTFDAILVTTMQKDDAYLNSTDWYEDYPEGEYHKSLKIEDNGNYLTSSGRYKIITSESLLVKADSVLTTSVDYICITMGANVGTFVIKVDDFKVGSDNIFLYTLEDEFSNIKINLSLKQGKETKIINVPIGNYTLTLNDAWSWKYNDKLTATILKGEEEITISDINEFNLNIIGGMTTIVNTKYNIKNNLYFSKNIFTKIPINYNITLNQTS